MYLVPICLELEGDSQETGSSGVGQNYNGIK